MLSYEDNEILCRVGAGTPMGELLRRFWMPALLASELPAPDAPPLRLRILAEDLVAFRDTNGDVGILDAYCPHKAAPLFMGRNEECGLRCIYHGWKFDVKGNCLDVANEPVNTELKNKVKVKSYPVQELGDLIWVYLGPHADPPEAPHMEWAHVPKEHQHISRWLQCTNWAQGLEGELDSSHISFLHRSLKPQKEFRPSTGTSRPPNTVWNGAPHLALKETDYGFVYGARRNTGHDEYYWRTTQWYLPLFTMIANDAYPRSGRAWVPVDDSHVMSFSFNYDPEKPISDAYRDEVEDGATFPPHVKQGAYLLPDGYVIDTFIPDANRGNDYLLDRSIQKTDNYSGIFGANNQDRGVQENMRSVPGMGPGKMADRSREYLVSADMPVITARRRLIKMAKDLRDGIEPEILAHPEAYGVRTISPITGISDFDTLITEFEDEVRAIVSMP